MSFAKELREHKVMKLTPDPNNLTSVTNSEHLCTCGFSGSYDEYKEHLPTRE